MSKKILFVDDDQEFLIYLKSLLKNKNYNILTASSGEEALNILENEDIQLIISDLKMPQMNGYELLKQVKQSFKFVIRVLMSENPEESIVLKALQKNYASINIVKPLKDQYMINLINQLIITQEILAENNLVSLVNNMEELPTIKRNYQKIMQMIENDESMNKIAEELEKDFAIATKILHLANSAYYAVKTGSIRQAISYLGLLNINNLIMTSSVLDILDCTGMAEKMSIKMWEHANLSNKIVECIYKKILNKKLKHTEMSAGLLHDIGKVILLKNFTSKYLKLNYEVEYHGVIYSEAEKSIFNTSHEKVGGYLLKWWDFPYPIVEAALFHHEPFKENIINRELICVVHLADYYACELLKIGCSNKLDERVLEYLNLDKFGIDILIKNTFKVL